MADRPERKLTTRELLQQLPRALTLVWEASRTNALLLSGLTLVQAVLPAANWPRNWIRPPARLCCA